METFFLVAICVTAFAMALSIMVLAYAASLATPNVTVATGASIAVFATYILLQVWIWNYTPWHEYWHYIIAGLNAITAFLAVMAVMVGDSTKKGDTVEWLGVILLVISVSFLAVFFVPAKAFKMLNLNAFGDPRIPDLSTAKWPNGVDEITLPRLNEHGAKWVAKEVVKDAAGNEVGKKDVWVHGTKYIPADPKNTQEIYFYIQYGDGMTTDVAPVKKGTDAVQTGRKASTKGIKWPKATQEVSFPDPQEIGALWMVEAAPGAAVPVGGNKLTVPAGTTEIQVYILYQDGTRTDSVKVEQEK